MKVFVTFNLIIQQSFLCVFKRKREGLEHRLHNVTILHNISFHISVRAKFLEISVWCIVQSDP